MNETTALSSFPQCTLVWVLVKVSYLPTFIILLLCFVERDPSENAAFDQYLGGYRKKYCFIQNGETSAQEEIPLQPVFECFEYLV